MRVWMTCFASALIFTNTVFAEVKDTNLTYVKYDNYELWLDCSNKAAVAFRYISGSDTANLTRYSNFYKSPNIPSDCHQLSRETYKHQSPKLPKYDRGHLAAANHFDFSKKALRQANYMSNVMPQSVKLNRGAWKRTEELIECYRDNFPVTTMGGVIWGSDARNDKFKISHGIKTPDSYWRLLFGSADGKDYYIAWILPNDESASSSMLKHYEVSHEELIKAVEPNVSSKFKTELEKLEIQQGKPFKYKKGCVAYAS
jgi:endonuclease G